MVSLVYLVGSLLATSHAVVLKDNGAKSPEEFKAYMKTAHFPSSLIDPDTFELPKDVENIWCTPNSPTARSAEMEQCKAGSHPECWKECRIRSNMNLKKPGTVVYWDDVYEKCDAAYRDQYLGHRWISGEISAHWGMTTGNWHLERCAMEIRRYVIYESKCDDYSGFLLMLRLPEGSCGWRRWNNNAYLDCLKYLKGCSSSFDDQCIPFCNWFGYHFGNIVWHNNYDWTEDEERCFPYYNYYALYYFFLELARLDRAFASACNWVGPRPDSPDWQFPHSWDSDPFGRPQPPRNWPPGETCARLDSQKPGHVWVNPPDNPCTMDYPTPHAALDSAVDPPPIYYPPHWSAIWKQQEAFAE